MASETPRIRASGCIEGTKLAKRSRQSAKGNIAIKQERTYMKATFSLDVEVLERLRAVAFSSREPMSQIVERLIRNFVKGSKVRIAPRKPRSTD